MRNLTAIIHICSYSVFFNATFNYFSPSCRLELDHSEKSDQGLSLHKLGIGQHCATVTNDEGYLGLTENIAIICVLRAVYLLDRHVGIKVEPNRQSHDARVAGPVFISPSPSGLAVDFLSLPRAQ